MPFAKPQTADKEALDDSHISNSFLRAKQLPNH